MPGAVELVTDYLEDVLSAPERIRLEAHLAGCPYCKAYIAQMRRTINALGELTPEMVSRGRREQLVEASAAGAQRGHRRVTRRRCRTERP